MLCKATSCSSRRAGTVYSGRALLRAGDGALRSDTKPLSLLLTNVHAVWRAALHSVSANGLRPGCGRVNDDPPTETTRAPSDCAFLPLPPGLMCR